jgi:hypothetical protein
MSYNASEENLGIISKLKIESLGCKWDRAGCQVYFKLWGTG